MAKKERTTLTVEEKLVIKGLLFQRKKQELELSKLDFQTYAGSYYDFLKAKGRIQNKIDDINREINFYTRVLSSPATADM